MVGLLIMSTFRGQLSLLRLGIGAMRSFSRADAVHTSDKIFEAVERVRDAQAFTGLQHNRCLTRIQDMAHGLIQAPLFDATSGSENAYISEMSGFGNVWIRSFECCPVPSVIWIFCFPCAISHSEPPSGVQLYP